MTHHFALSNDGTGQLFSAASWDIPYASAPSPASSSGSYSSSYPTPPFTPLQVDHRSILFTPSSTPSPFNQPMLLPPMPLHTSFPSSPPVHPHHAHYGAVHGTYPQSFPSSPPVVHRSGVPHSASTSAPSFGVIDRLGRQIAESNDHRQADRDARQHERRSVGFADRTCRFCNREFDRPSACATHENSHTNNRPHVCAFCSADFTAQSNMLRHQRKCKDRHARYAQMQAGSMQLSRV